MYVLITALNNNNNCLQICDQSKRLHDPLLGRDPPVQRRSPDREQAAALLMAQSKASTLSEVAAAADAAGKRAPPR